MQEFEVVLANSSVVRAAENFNPDLFWALRGGGPNFGIVTVVTLEVFPQDRSWYTFQRWNLSDIRAVFQRLDHFTRSMPTDIQMIATNLGWSAWRKEFVLSDRIVAVTDNIHELSNMAAKGGGVTQDDLSPAEEHVYRRTTLEMAQVMDVVNEDGFYNFFGSVTVKSDEEINLKIAEIFQEASKILDIPGIKVYIVYNPVTSSTIRQMKRRGGNALGIRETDGPLTSESLYSAR